MESGYLGRSRDTARAMSQENVEIVRRVLDAFNRRDEEGMLADLHPEVEWVNPPDAVEPGIRSGHEEFASATQAVADTFEDTHVEVHEAVDAGDQVVVVAKMRGRGRESGVDFEVWLSYVFTFRDGKAARFEWFNSPTQAFEAAGLRE